MIKGSQIWLSCAILLSLALLSCDGSPVFDETPEISFVSITPERVVQNSPDAITLTLHFQDGDGDLGVLNPADNTTNLFAYDTRLAVPEEFRHYEYTVPNLTPDTKNPSIQGTIEITMTVPQLSKNYPPFSGPNEEEIVFQIHLYDRAGNKSNVIETTPITITQQ